jgi:hypothetical protein
MNVNGGDYGIFAQIINQGGPKTLYENYLSADHHKNSRLFFDYKVNMLHHNHLHSHGYTHHHG